MKPKLASVSIRVCIWASVFFLPITLLSAPSSSLKLEAQLVWGTTNKTSPNPAHKPVEPAIKKKLKELPLKWSNYFEVNKQQIVVPAGGATKVPMSKQCAIEVKDLGHSTIEVSHFGKGEHVLKRTQALPKGETFILGGNAPEATSWFIILKRVD